MNKQNIADEMTDWKPIILSEIYDQVISTENNLTGELWNFWQLIRINPTKWTEKEFDKNGGGFWVVAICGNRIIWYNDIEGGFNISSYKTYGQIEGYYCDQVDLKAKIIDLFDLIKFGGEVSGQAGPPINLK